MFKVVNALLGHGLRFKGGFRTRDRARSKYMPHNGEQEKARRVRQMLKQAVKNASHE